MTPSEKMSDRASTDLPRTCSGDMYIGVPRMMPVRVMEASLMRAMPKSTIFTCPSFKITMFAGLTSR